MATAAGSPASEAEIIRMIGDATRSVAAQSIPGEARLPSTPGLYSWWADTEAQSTFGRVLGVAVVPLVYVGQAGAGTSATLASRILRNHITGSMRRSTFRRTVGAVLQTDRGGRPQTEDDVTTWIRTHLSVVAVPVHERRLIADVEEAALRHYDPPLNLKGMRRSDARARLSALRAAITV